MRILSLDPEDALKVAAVQAVDATPESLLMLDSPVAESGADGTGAGAATLFLHTGAHHVCSSAADRCLELHGRVRKPMALARAQPHCSCTLVRIVFFPAREAAV